MKVVFSQLQYVVTQFEFDKIQNKEITVESLSPRKIVGTITKSISDAPIPRIGESVSDSYWPRNFEEQKVVKVCYDLTEDCCFVYLEPFVIPDTAPLHNDIKRIAELHEWEFQRT